MICKKVTLLLFKLRYISYLHVIYDICPERERNTWTLGPRDNTGVQMNPIAILKPCQIKATMKSLGFETKISQVLNVYTV